MYDIFVLFCSWVRLLFDLRWENGDRTLREFLEFGGEPNLFKRNLVSVIVVGTSLSLVSSVAQAAPITDQQRNIVPAILSFDYAVAALGLGFGIDNSFSNQIADGLITDTGFNWTASGIYQGSAFQWTSSGTYDVATNSLSWSGSGNYSNSIWSLDGDINWTSDKDFSIAHQTTILVDGNYNSDVTVGRDQGTVKPTISASSIKYEIERSKHSFWGFLWDIDDGIDNVTVSVDGKIIENNLTIKKESTGVGVNVKLVGGTFTIDNNEFHKETKIEPVPEPLTILGSMAALGFGTYAERKRKLSESSAKDNTKVS